MTYTLDATLSQKHTHCSLIITGNNRRTRKFVIDLIQTKQCRENRVLHGCTRLGANAASVTIAGSAVVASNHSCALTLSYILFSPVTFTFRGFLLAAVFQMAHDPLNSDPLIINSPDSLKCAWICRLVFAVFPTFLFRFDQERYMGIEPEV